MLIDFWATWCGPCLKALEDSNRLARQYGDRLVVLAVAVDSEETRPRAAKYLKEHGYNFTLLYDDPNRRELPVAGVPGRYVIDEGSRAAA